MGYRLSLQSLAGIRQTQLIYVRLPWVFTGLLQEKYGYTRQQASDEIDRRVTEYESNMKMKSKLLQLQLSARYANKKLIV